MSEFIHHVSTGKKRLPKPKTPLEVERYVYVECESAVNSLIEQLRMAYVFPKLTADIQREPLICALHSNIMWSVSSGWSIPKRREKDQAKKNNRK